MYPARKEVNAPLTSRCHDQSVRSGVGPSCSVRLSDSLSITVQTTETMARTKSAITVVIADDHPLFRKGLRRLLEAHPSLDVVGDATGGREAIRLVLELQPDILLLQLVRPVASSLETLRELSTFTPRIRTLLLAEEVADSDVIDMRRLGACGVVMKHDACPLLFKAICAVVAGRYWAGREGLVSPLAS
jgi:CheY-like chemotaxis protein